MSQSVAIVTGASQGIGQSTAVRLARDFDSVALVARNRANLERTATAVNAAGAESLVIDVDLPIPPQHAPSSTQPSPPSAASTPC